MEKEAFYSSQAHEEGFELTLNSPAHLRHERDAGHRYDDRRLDPAYMYDATRDIGQLDYDHVIGERRGARWREDQAPVDDFARSRGRPSARSPRHDDKYSSRYRDHGDDGDRKSRSRGYGHGSEDPSGRRNQRSKSRDRDRDRDDRRSRDRERSRDRDRSRRRSRSRDRDRDRRHRDSDRDRRHRDSDRERPRRDHDRDRGERERDSKEVPWVPPPLPEHLRHLQVQWALAPVVAGQQQQSSSASMASLQPSAPAVQNQFQNDGSFLEMFRQKMQQSTSQTPDTSKPVERPVEPAASVPITDAPPAAPTLAATSSGLPVIAKRRISKILKTGVVQKKKKEEEEDQEADADGWSSYMKEVKKYRANKCIENEASRPPLVK